LQLDVGWFLCVLPLEQEVVVLYFLLHGCLGAFDLVHLYGVFGLLLVKGLQQLTHYLAHLGFHLVPLELSYFNALFLLLPRHLLLYPQPPIRPIPIKLQHTNKGICQAYH
jgi:hypothetical protein